MPYSHAIAPQPYNDQLTSRKKISFRSIACVGASIMALAISTPAQAACTTSSNSAICSGTLTERVFVMGDGASIQSSATISTTDSSSIGISNAALYAASIDAPPENGSVRVISTGPITTSGNGTSGILASAATTVAQGRTGNAEISSSGDIATSGDMSYGLLAYSNGALSSVHSTGSITTSGTSALGIYAIAADDTNISASKSITTSGTGAHGILSFATNVTIGATGSVLTTGNSAAGVLIGQIGFEDGLLRRTGNITGDIHLTLASVQTEGAGATAIDAGSSTGSVNITINSVQTTGADSVGILTSGGGEMTVEAGSVEVTGKAGIHATSSGDVSIQAGSVSNSADDAYGIFAQSTHGHVTIDSGPLVLTGDQPLLYVAEPPKLNDTSALRVIAQVGDANIRVTDITSSGLNGRGIFASARNVNITADGDIIADTGMIAQAMTGNVTVAVNGTIDSSLIGVSALTRSGTIAITNGSMVTGGRHAIFINGTTDANDQIAIYNHGSLESIGDAAIAGTHVGDGLTHFYIKNDGAISSGASTAILTAGGDDNLEITENSRITGIVDLGAGDDRLTLDFNNNAASDAVGIVATTVNVEGLSVDTGRWYADGLQSAYDFVEIEQGATLTIADNSDGELAIITDLVELDGTLRLNLHSPQSLDTLDAVSIIGGGSIHLVGNAAVELSDASGLAHTGGTFVENGTLLLTTGFGGDITTSGSGVFELAEGGDYTGNLVNDGTFVFARNDSYSFTGDFTGSGHLEKHGNGALTFAGHYGFGGTTSILGGRVVFTGQLDETLDLDITDGVVDLSQSASGLQTIAQLSGTGGTIELGAAQLTINQTGNTVYTGAVSGTGAIIKDGDGDLKLDGDGSDFTGTGEVNAGTLSVNGDFSNANFIVNEGGTLGGAGTIGSAAINAGTLAPGNSIDTLTVAGNLAFTASSTYQVEVDAAGNADSTRVEGNATLGNAQVNVVAASGVYRALTDYTILTAEEGIEGVFGGVETNLAYLNPSLTYTGNSVTLRLTRNLVNFADRGETPNQIAIATLIEDSGHSHALYNEALSLASGDVTRSLASLTGEIYPAYGAALIETAEALRRQTSLGAAKDGSFAWATGLYNSVEGRTERGKLALSGAGVAGGIGFSSNGLTASAGLGILDQGRGSDELHDSKITFAVGHLGYQNATGLSVKAGAQFAWADAHGRRQTLLGAINSPVTASISADYVQLFAELSHVIPAGAGLKVEPFAGISNVSIDLDETNEVGALTALIVEASNRSVTFANLGMRMSTNPGAKIRPFASAAYRKAFGDRSSIAAVGFANTSQTTQIGALPIAKNAAELSAGISISAGSVDFEFGYDGLISKKLDSHGAKLKASIRF